MKRNKNEFWRYLLNRVFVPACLFVQTQLYAQQLFTYLPEAQLTQQQQKNAQYWIQSSASGKIAYATFDKSVLYEEGFYFNTPESEMFRVTHEKTVTRHENDFSWFGDIDKNEGRLNLVYHNGMLTGYFQMKGNKWRVHPLGEGLHLIYEVNSSDFKDESEQDYANMLNASIIHQLQADGMQDAEDGFMAGDCNIRVFVAYTDDAEIGIGADVNGFIQSCIDVSNDCYDNSSVSFNIELARSQKVFYDESLNSSTDKSCFRNTADGCLDDIHTTRSVYDADLNVLLVYGLESGICGSAYTVSVSSYANAFCVARVSCAIDNYTFPHELGHLFGCRHDVYVDDTEIPYAYGHGFVNLVDEWRTVMAYNNLCEDYDADCERLPYFSNPSVTYFGDQMGLSGVSDNESALESSMSAISGLETTVSAKSLGAETIEENEKGDVIASTSVVNSSSYTISSGADMTWRAGSFLKMNVGFQAVSGSDFHGFLDSCDPLRLASEDESPGEVIALSNNLHVFPNPFDLAATMSLELFSDALVTVRLLDVLGHQIKTITHGELYTAGQHAFTVQGEELSAGMYLIEVIINGERSIMQIVKAD